MRKAKISTITRRAALAAAAAALLAAGCIFSPPPPTGDIPIDYWASPDNVLTAIENSYKGRDINLYKGALDQEKFVFYFNPNDVGKPVGTYIIPISWTYTEDYEATGNMFQEAYTISLEIQPVGKPPEGATEFIAYNVAINLLVMVDEVDGYRADQGYCNFKFKKYIEEGKVHWRLVQWWDFTIA